MIDRERRTRHFKRTACDRKFSSPASIRRHYCKDHATAQRSTLCGKVLRTHGSHYGDGPGASASQSGAAQ